MKTIPELLKEYIHEYCRTTGKDGNFVVSYSKGWFRLCQNATAVRRAEFEKMIEALKTRSTVTSRQELVNGVMTMIEAHQHVVKSMMPPHKDVIEARDTPYGCSVADEAYWSN